MVSTASTSCLFPGMKLLAALSICMIAGGLLLPSMLQLALDAGIRSKIVWQADSPPDVDARYRGSTSPSSPPDIVQIWLFNITNVEDIRLGNKPILQQVGPYTYRKYKVKVSSWWDQEGNVACKEYDYFIPLPEMTGADLNASIVTLNMPLVGVVETIHARFWPISQLLLDHLVKVIADWKDGHVNGLFIQRSAEELIWGYEDLLLQRLSWWLPHGVIKTTLVQLMHNMSGPEEALATEPVVYDTGRYNMDSIWNTVSFQGLTETKCWNNCTERVRGSDGSQFKPGVTPEQRLAVWVAALFRAEDFVFKEHITWDDVRFLRFWPDPEGLQPNACHFQSIRGLLNITTPMAVGFNGTAADSTGPPIYVSQPHFCLCDDSLAAAVEGVQCNMSNHLTYIDVEPITGIPMRGHLTMMVSSEITLAARTHLEPKMAKASNESVVMPIFWTQEDIHATPQDLANFRGSVYRVMWAQQVLRKWATVSGACLLVLVVVVQVVHVVRQRRGVGVQRDEGEREDAEQGSGNGTNALGAGMHGEPTSVAAAAGPLTQPLLQHSS